MKSKKRNLLLAVTLFTGIMPLTAQDINYTQYQNVPLYYNPAFTGITPGFRARFLFRDQWPQLPIDFKSYYFSADLGDRNLPGAGGIGLLVNSDYPGMGLINSLTLGLTFSVRIPLSSFLIAQLGVKAAMLQKRVNWDDMVFSEQLDERYGAIYQSSFPAPDANKRIAPDFAVGGIAQFSNQTGNVTGNAGFSVDHLFKPDVSFLANEDSRVPRKWVVHGDVIISTGAGSSSGFSSNNNDPLKINLGVLYQNQNELNAFQAGINLVKYGIYLGGWFKSTLNGPSPNNMFSILAGYRYIFADNMSIRFIYSYDIQVSGALQGTGGAHEIGLVLDFENWSLIGGNNGRGGGGRYITPNRKHSNAAPFECSEF